MENSFTLTVNDAARSLGIERTHLYRLIGEGKVETVLLGRRRLVKTAKNILGLFWGLMSYIKHKKRVNSVGY